MGQGRAEDRGHSRAGAWIYGGAGPGPGTVAAGRAGNRRGGRGAGGAMVSDGRGVRRLSLEPIELPRPWWRRHRYWLASPAPVVGTGATVVNMRTGEVHDWHFRGNRRGRGWFGVRTRWLWPTRTG